MFTLSLKGRLSIATMVAVVATASWFKHYMRAEYSQLLLNKIHAKCAALRIQFHLKGSETDYIDTLMNIVNSTEWMAKVSKLGVHSISVTSFVGPVGNEDGVTIEFCFYVEAATAEVLVVNESESESYKEIVEVLVHSIKNVTPLNVEKLAASRIEGIAQLRTIASLR